MTRNKIILISGKQGSGKTELSTRLKKYSGLSMLSAKFADPLYQMHESIRTVCNSNGIPFDKKEGKLLQLLGTEWLRNKDNDIFVNSMKHSIKKLEDSGFCGTILIDDCRFKNELFAFPEAFKVRLEAPLDVRKNRAEGFRDNHTHISETDLDDCMLEFNTTINTNLLTPDEVYQLVLGKYLKWKHS